MDPQDLCKSRHYGKLPTIPALERQRHGIPRGMWVAQRVSSEFRETLPVYPYGREQSNRHLMLISNINMYVYAPSHLHPDTYENKYAHTHHIRTYAENT